MNLQASFNEWCNHAFCRIERECACRGFGHACHPDLDAWHQCRFHFRGQPHPEWDYDEEAEVLKASAIDARAKAELPCPKCGGGGHLPRFSHIQAGRCFRCDGTGKDPGVLWRARRRLIKAGQARNRAHFERRFELTVREETEKRGAENARARAWTRVLAAAEDHANFNHRHQPH